VPVDGAFRVTLFWDVMLTPPMLDGFPVVCVSTKVVPVVTPLLVAQSEQETLLSDWITRSPLAM
jgi:hypothetical protein